MINMERRIYKQVKDYNLMIVIDDKEKRYVEIPIPMGTKFHNGLGNRMMSEKYLNSASLETLGIQTSPMEDSIAWRFFLANREGLTFIITSKDDAFAIFRNVTNDFASFDMISQIQKLFQIYLDSHTKSDFTCKLHIPNEVIGDFTCDFTYINKRLLLKGKFFQVTYYFSTHTWELSVFSEEFGKIDEYSTIKGTHIFDGKEHLGLLITKETYKKLGNYTSMIISFLY